MGLIGKVIGYDRDEVLARREIRDRVAPWIIAFALVIVEFVRTVAPRQQVTSLVALQEIVAILAIHRIGTQIADQFISRRIAEEVIVQFVAVDPFDTDQRFDIPIAVVQYLPRGKRKIDDRASVAASVTEIDTVRAAAAVIGVDATTAEKLVVAGASLERIRDIGAHH